MKMILITYNVSVEAELLHELETLEVASYTHWPHVLGVGKDTGARLDDNVWPGYNGAIMAVVPDEKAAPIMAMVENMRQTIAKREGIRAFQMSVEKMTGEL